VEYDLFPKDTLSMRPPERDYESNPSSPHIHPRARSPSLSPSPKANGHVANGHGSPMNGSSKHSKSPVPRVELPGATIYDDSYIDREEYIRLVIQSLRDIGYMCVLLLLCYKPNFNLPSRQRICSHIGGRVRLCYGDVTRCRVPSVYSGRYVE
jgi:hypothetical protein